MSNDITKYVEQIVTKLTGNKDLIAQFKQDPVKAVTSILGIKLDGDLLQSVIKAVQGKIDLGELTGQARGILGKIKKLLGLGK